MVERIDFYDLQKQLLMDSGRDPSDVNSLENLRLLRFEENEQWDEGKDRLMSRLPDRTPVFLENGHKDDVRTNETWICMLDRKCGRFAFATPIRRVDEFLLMKMDPESKDMILDMLWERHRDELMESFEERCRSQAPDVCERSIDDDDNVADEIARLSERIIELEEKSRRDDLMISRLLSLGPENHSERPDSAITVSRIGNNKFTSEAFRECRYRTLRSLDGRTLRFMPDSEGRSVCSSNTVTVPWDDLPESSRIEAVASGGTVTVRLAGTS